VSPLRPALARQASAAPHDYDQLYVRQAGLRAAATLRPALLLPLAVPLCRVINLYVMGDIVCTCLVPTAGRATPHGASDPVGALLHRQRICALACSVSTLGTLTALLWPRQEICHAKH